MLHSHLISLFMEALWTQKYFDKKHSILHVFSLQLFYLTMKTYACVATGTDFHCSCSSVTTRVPVSWLSVMNNFLLTYSKCCLSNVGQVSKPNPLCKSIYSFFLYTSVRYHLISCADTHLHPPTNVLCPPDNKQTHRRLILYSIWRASPVSLSLRYQADSGVARMSFILLTGTSLGDSNSQPSSAQATFSL